jgi:hypothetical protein
MAERKERHNAADEEPQANPEAYQDTARNDERKRISMPFVFSAPTLILFGTSERKSIYMELSLDSHRFPMFASCINFSSE